MKKVLFGFGLAIFLGNVGQLFADPTPTDFPIISVNTETSLETITAKKYLLLEFASPG